jgi:AraC-like DNA-binding protein
LLEADAGSVTEICFGLGYSSLGSFSTLFAERVGCPPIAWRRRFVQAGWIERNEVALRAVVLPSASRSAGAVETKRRS